MPCQILYGSLLSQQICKTPDFLPSSRILGLPTSLLVWPSCRKCYNFLLFIYLIHVLLTYAYLPLLTHLIIHCFSPSYLFHMQPYFIPWHLFHLRAAFRPLLLHSSIHAAMIPKLYKPFTVVEYLFSSLFVQSSHQAILLLYPHRSLLLKPLWNLDC